MVANIRELIDVHLAAHNACIDGMLQYIHKYANVLAIFNAHQITRLIIIYLIPLTALCFMDKTNKHHCIMCMVPTWFSE